MDIKAIEKTGKYTIKSVMEKASKQGAETVILYQKTPSMTRQYIEDQIKKFKELSPIKARAKIKQVIVVGNSGSVHRRVLSKK